MSATGVAGNQPASSYTVLMVSSLTQYPGRRPEERLRQFGRYPRIMGLDIARALAIIGMIAAHTAVIDGHIRWSDFSTWADLANGRPSMLFAVLGGISIALMTGGTTPPTRDEVAAYRVKLIARGLAIFAVGVFLEFLGTPILVILGLYGVLYVLVLPFIRWRPRHLLVLSAVIMLLGPTILPILQLLLSSMGPGVNLVFQGSYSLAAWMSLLLLGLAIGRTSLASIKKAVALIAVGVLMAAGAYGLSHAMGMDGSDDWAGKSLSGGSSFSSVGSAYPDSGFADDYLAESNIDLSQEDLSGYYCDRWVDGAITCTTKNVDDVMGSSKMGIEGTVNRWPEVQERFNVEELSGMALSSFLSSAPHSGGSLEIVGSGGIALVVIGLCLLAGRFLRPLFIPLAALGAMPLTAYTLHVVAIWVATGPQGSVADNAFFIGLTLGLLIFATLWLAFVGRGPLEQLPIWASKKLR